MSDATPIAIVIRMACMRAEVAVRSGHAYVAVSRQDAPSADGELALTDSSPESVISAIAGHVDAQGELPAAVSVDGVSYRIDTPAAGTARLAGRIVIVTGSGQGFGKGIAEGLVAQGAHVVVADINAETGQAAVDAMCEQFGDRAAVFLPINVTSQESVVACVQATVDTFGGLDMLIANAGVLKAGGLDEITESDFDFVTSVNYKGYFLCAQAASAVMRQQHALNPDHLTDIIQMNSKSGLEGSKRNFAYAGSKFGGIGLTQSFALELITHGVKVNSICPGNFFDGPLWSDPERGLFVQYLNAGKVEGAKTVDDVRAFYMSKVPMGRGCTPADVVTAIRYLHEQSYETGHALPVSGGQTMLN